VGVTVGVFGATGYTGRELVRWLARHPELRVSFTTGSGEGHLAHELGLEQPAEAYFLALPHGIAARYVAQLHARFPAATLVDLSGDLRLPDAPSYKLWYGLDHPAPELLGRTPYGLTEVFREQIAGARIVSNPGCYATSVLLPLLPLVSSGLIDSTDIVVDAKSGASGAGRALREDLLFCELTDDFSAYSPGRTHRHVGEIEPLLSARAGAPVTITFCPHLLPVKRGILSALYLRAHSPAGEVALALRSFYEGSPFVSITERPPRLSDVVHTNECHISVHEAAPGRIVIFSAIDNLVKGAAGQAIQNLNVALGWPETAGLEPAVRR